jgi:hypothetical protein
MSADALNKTIREIAQQLSQNARERAQLQTLLRVAAQAREDVERFGRDQSAVPKTERISRFRSRKGGDRP